MNTNNNVKNMNLNNPQKIHMYALWVALYLFFMLFFPLTTIKRGDENLNSYFLIGRIRHHWVTNLLPSIPFVVVKYALKIIVLHFISKKNKIKKDEKVRKKKNPLVIMNTNSLFYFLCFTFCVLLYTLPIHNFSYIHLTLLVT